MIAILLAEGFEEIEALTPLDLMLRAGLDVKTVSIGERTVTGAHGIKVCADMLCSELDTDSVEHLILPGGMPGAKNLDEAPITDELINKVLVKGGRLAAICAAPMILGHRGLLIGKRATCYPGFESELTGAEVVEDGVITDGRITTARGMGVALGFGLELVALLSSLDEGARLARTVMSEEEFKPSAGVLEPLSSTYPYTQSKPYFDKLSKTEAAYLAEAVYKASDKLKLNLELKDVSRGYRSTSFTLTTELNMTKKLAGDLKRLISEETGRAVRVENDDTTVNVTVENSEAYFPYIGQFLTSSEFKLASSPLTLFLGTKDDGTPIYASLEKMRHLAIVGDTQNDLDSMLDAIILSIIEKSSAESVKLMLADPEGGSLSCYSSLPHLLSPVAVGGKETLGSLIELGTLMEERYRMLEESGVRSITEYKEKVGGEAMPHTAVILRGLGDKNDESRSALYECLASLIAKGRTVGIYVVISMNARDYDPDIPFIANLPTVIAFRTERLFDSLRILDSERCYTLFDRGEMIYRYAGSPVSLRLQAPYIPEGDIERAIEAKRALCTRGAEVGSHSVDNMSDEELFIEAMELICGFDEISCEGLKELIPLSTQKARDILALGKNVGILSEPDVKGLFRIIVTKEEWAVIRKRLNGEII